jgi:hypothetical protein
MILKFEEKEHKYTSLDPNDSVDWISVTSLIAKFKEPFDSVTTAEKVSKNKKSKWYGIKPELIVKAWDDERDRANKLGTWYHNQREGDVLSLETISRSGIELPIIKPIIENNVKLSPHQQLVPGIYPEHFVYLKSAAICGQSDRVEVVGEYVDITDYKTNKEIKTKGFVNWEGISKKLLKPVSHLDDCELNHYALQLSMYMYIILKHNHRLKPRNLSLQHVIFETDGENSFGYPITKLNDAGDPIVKEVIEYKVPYLKREVIDIINWLHENKIKNDR